MNETQALPTPEDELRIAQDRLSAAKARLAESERLRLGALAAKVAALTAERERKAAEEKAEADRIQQMHIDRKNRERDEEAMRQREEAAKTAAAQAELAREEARQQEARAREKRIADLATEAQALEAAAQAATAQALADLEFVEAGVATKTITPSATEDADHHSHPLSRFFNPEKETVPEVKGDISSEQQALMQSRLDAATEGNPALVYAATPAPVEPAPQVEPARKNKTSVDQALSIEVEDFIRRELKMNANRTTLDRLASIFHGTALMEATRTAIAQSKLNPTSHDALLQTIEQFADGLMITGGQ